LLVGSVAGLLVVGSTKADFTFGPPQNLGPVLNTPSNEASICTSADNLELYFASDRPGGLGGYDLYISTRQSLNDPWGPPINLGATVNGASDEAYPSLSSDGLTLYFSDIGTGTRPGGLGAKDLWTTTRASRSAPWGTPVNLGAPINSSAGEMDPTISGDGLLLVFCSSRSGGYGWGDLWMSTRATLQEAWGPPVNLGLSVNSAVQEFESSVSADGLAVFFVSWGPVGWATWNVREPTATMAAYRPAVSPHRYQRVLPRRAASRPAGIRFTSLIRQNLSEV